jgi:hypothetical protein
VLTVTGVVDGYRILPESLMAINRRANSVKILRFSTPEKLYLYDTLFERLPQDLEDMAAELGPFIQAAHAVVRPRHLARHRHVAPADQPHIGDGVMGGTKRPGRDHGRTVAGEAGNAANAGDLNGFGQGLSRRMVARWRPPQGVGIPVSHAGHPSAWRVSRQPRSICRSMWF